MLLNSPGPHDHVRIRQPYAALQQLGLDCRIHERPFLFSQCIRPESLVIWQRPLPESRQRMWEHLQWLRERQCLLLVDWDDHPDLFPPTIQRALQDMAMAPLTFCHGILTSSPWLSTALRAYNPLSLCLDNGITSPAALNLNKHKRSSSATQPMRVLIGNQNRHEEHQALLEPLLCWLQDDEAVQLVIVGDQGLAKKLPPHRVERHGLLSYASFRQLMRSCSLALLPLSERTANRCKTVIKWQECAAESVAVIGGPELYALTLPDGVGTWARSLAEIVPLARALKRDLLRRCQQVEAAHRALANGWRLEDQSRWHQWVLEQLWRRRRWLDAATEERIRRGGDAG